MKYTKTNYVTIDSETFEEIEEYGGEPEEILKFIKSKEETING
ncbi:MAG: hypothetical protein ACOCRO_11755 [Halanaerobiales bacterium]